MSISLLCGNCGAAIGDGARFCQVCGRSADGTPPPPPALLPTPQHHYQPQPSPVYVQHIAPAKSFTTPAVITMILYLVLWLPGLIANLVYLNEANAARQQSGVEPEGRGCLLALIVVFGLLPLLLIGGGFGLVFLLAALGSAA